MKIWQDITTTGLMGTERHTLKLPAREASSPVDEALSLLDATDPDGSLLSAAAIAGVYRRSGTILSEVTEQPASAAAQDDWLECSPRATHLLYSVFAGDYAGLASEALDLLIATRLRFAPTLLTEVLDFGRRQTDVRERISQVVGKRGTWLASQNPAWSYLGQDLAASSSQPLEDDWAFASRATRLQTLASLRRRDPATARRLLESTWTEDGAEDRAAFVTALRTGLSIDDEPFLESALDDRSKDVRSASAGVLALLPQSQLIRRMKDRLRPLLNVRYQFGSGHKLDVTLSGEPDAGAIRDGITAAAKSPAEGGRAGVLREMLSVIPPAYWSSAFERSADEIVEMADKSEWADTIITGLSLAAGRHPSDDWTMALLQSNANPAAMSGPNGAIFAEAVSVVNQDKLEAYLTSVLGGRPLALPGPFRSALPLHTRPWSVDFADAFLRKARQTLLDYSDNETTSAVIIMLRDAAPYVPVELVDEFSTVVPEDLTTKSYWARTVSQAVDMVRFRKDLREAIGPGPSPQPLPEAGGGAD